MSKLRNNKKGFSAVEVIVVLCIVALIGAIAWFVYSKSHTNYTSYSDCISHGGQSLSYDKAIQFKACLGRGANQLFLQYSAQNMPNVTQNKTTTTANKVVSNSSDSADLISYLTYSDEGCSVGQPNDSTATGYYKIVKEVPGWALLNYGCTNDKHALSGDYSMIAMKLSNGWVELSPTNNFSANGTPSCLLVDMFKIPSTLVPQCYQNTGYNDGSLRSVANQ